MRAWAFLLAGLLAWTCHFFAVYAIGSILPGTVEAKLLVGIATIIALGATVWLLVRARRGIRHAADDTERWGSRLSAFTCWIALLSIAYQGLPVLFN